MNLQHTQPTQEPKREKTVLAALLALVMLCLLAVFLDVHVPQAEHFHAFADQRSWLNLPFTFDVLSNIPFFLIGSIGLLQISRLKEGVLLSTEKKLLRLSFAGLIVTAFASAFYHWEPSDFGLLIDRLGMSIAFAGLLGLAVATSTSQRMGITTAVIVLICAPTSVLYWYHTNNLLLWVVLQGAGMMGLAAAAMSSTRTDSLQISWSWVIALYVIAKGFEVADHNVFELSSHMFSGHSVKHLIAALAIVPLNVSLNHLGNKLAFKVGAQLRSR